MATRTVPSQDSSDFLVFGARRSTGTRPLGRVDRRPAAVPLRAPRGSCGSRPRRPSKPMMALPFSNRSGSQAGVAPSGVKRQRGRPSRRSVWCPNALRPRTTAAYAKRESSPRNAGPAIGEKRVPRRIGGRPLFHDRPTDAGAQVEPPTGALDGLARHIAMPDRFLLCREGAAPPGRVGADGVRGLRRRGYGRIAGPVGRCESGGGVLGPRRVGLWPLSGIG